MPGKDTWNQENQFIIWLTKTSSQLNQPFATTENVLKSPYLNLIKSIHLFFKQFLKPNKLLFYIPDMDHIIITYLRHGS